jgi:hypothetical protein
MSGEKVISRKEVEHTKTAGVERSRITGKSSYNGDYVDWRSGFSLCICQNVLMVLATRDNTVGPNFTARTLKWERGHRALRMSHP